MTSSAADDADIDALLALAAFACSTCGRTDLPEAGDWDPPICEECDAAINFDHADDGAEDEDLLTRRRGRDGSGRRVQDVQPHPARALLPALAAAAETRREARAAAATQAPRRNAGPSSSSEPARSASGSSERQEPLDRSRTAPASGGKDPGPPRTETEGQPGAAAATPTMQPQRDVHEPEHQAAKVQPPQQPSRSPAPRPRRRTRRAASRHTAPGPSRPRRHAMTIARRGRAPASASPSERAHAPAMPRIETPSDTRTSARPTGVSKHELGRLGHPLEVLLPRHLEDRPRELLDREQHRRRASATASCASPPGTPSSSAAGRQRRSRSGPTRARCSRPGPIPDCARPPARPAAAARTRGTRTRRRPTPSRPTSARPGWRPDRAPAAGPVAGAHGRRLTIVAKPLSPPRGAPRHARQAVRRCYSPRGVATASANGSTGPAPRPAAATRPRSASSASPPGRPPAARARTARPARRRPASRPRVRAPAGAVRHRACGGPSADVRQAANGSPSTDASRSANASTDPGRASGRHAGHPLRHRVRAPAAADDLHRGTGEMVLEPGAVPGAGPPRRRPPAPRPSPTPGRPGCTAPARSRWASRSAPPSGHWRRGSIPRTSRRRYATASWTSAGETERGQRTPPSFAQCPHSPAAGSLSSRAKERHPAGNPYRRTRASTPARVAAPRAPPPPRPRPAPRARPCARTAPARAPPPRPPRAA